MLSADADFFLEQLHETLQAFVANLCQTLTGGRLETVRQVQQLGLEMIEAKALVVVVPFFRLWVQRVVQRTAHAPGNVEGTRHAEHAKGVEAVGVLDDFRFEGDGRDVGAEAMGFDGVDDRCDFCARPIQGYQYCRSFLRRQP